MGKERREKAPMEAAQRPSHGQSLPNVHLAKTAGDSHPLLFELVKLIAREALTRAQEGDEAPGEDQHT